MESARDIPAREWFEGPLGNRVLREEAALAPLALDDVFGFELLQVGAWGPARHLLDGARTQHTILVAPETSADVTLCAPLDSLPFRSDSIDAIFLPHTLELVEDPYAVLREAERVLCAEGCLMICGFNPFSGWGIRRAFAKFVGGSVFPPETRRMLSERRLRDWVALLGFDVDSVYGYLGLLPTKGQVPRADARPHAEIRPRAAWITGAYLLKARKRVQTMTLVRPRRRLRQRVLVGAAEPTSKVGQ
ncbi:MAG: class I SAM-dependent methyltransferase [Steroidobacteraceae bacterium]